jgi:hypothetical protein
MSDLKMPTTYVCKKCKTSGKKLWRDYQTCCFNLTCYACSGETRDIDVNGKVHSEITDHRTDQLCFSRVPAVPVFDSDVESYWGYTSVPANEVDWWRKLPSK